MSTGQAHAVGVWFACNSGWPREASAIEACLRAFSSATWPAKLRFIGTQVHAAGTMLPQRGVVRDKERVTRLSSLLAHTEVWEVTLKSSREDAGGFAFLSVGTQPRVSALGPTFYGAQAFLLERADALQRWVKDMLELADKLNSRSGVVVVMDENAAWSEASMVGITSNFVLQHPYPEQFDRMARADIYLGDKYIRFPRWGTLLSHEHIAVLGGVEKIQQHVQPALVVPCGAGLYFQLTDSVATAMSAEALAKQAKFIELAQPLLPPLLP